MNNKHLNILGIRGVPAQHGGFETFAEKLSLHLISHGWDVTVYCQEVGGGHVYETYWHGIRRIHIPVKKSGASGTVIFDWKSIRHSLSANGMILTLGYNTAIFNLMHRYNRQINIINMDGIEWRRGKWGKIAKVWFWFNERIGCWVGNHLIADHPEILKHLSTRANPGKITMIPYGADEVCSADERLLRNYSLCANCYSLVIARPEPENSILEIVRAFSRKARSHKLVVLGSYNPDTNAYHRAVIDAASDEVVFLGAIYDITIVKALRFYCRLYLHGHQVGGTNPSLVEAMGAGSAIIAHDNCYNRWVAGTGAEYFLSEVGCETLLDRFLSYENSVNAMRTASRCRFQEEFTWEKILSDYERLLEDNY